MKTTGILINEYIENEKLKGLSKSTLTDKRRILEVLIEFIKKPAFKTEEEDIEKFMECKMVHLANQTYNWRLSVIKDFFSYLQEEGKTLHNPPLKLRYRNRDREKHLGVFTEEEIKRLLSVIPGNNKLGIRDRAMVELFYSTGLRAGELIGLNIGDVDFRHREVFVNNGKGNKSRIVPVGREALKALEKYLEVRESFRIKEYEALFISLHGRRINIVSVRSNIYKYKTKAGITNEGMLHAFRHSLATHMVNRGASIQSVSRILGHKSITTTEEYTHPDITDLQSIHRKTHPKAWRKE